MHNTFSNWKDFVRKEESNLSIHGKLFKLKNCSYKNIGKLFVKYKKLIG
jgi:hypothetical protein